MTGGGTEDEDPAAAASLSSVEGSVAGAPEVDGAGFSVAASGAEEAAGACLVSSGTSDSGLAPVPLTPALALVGAGAEGAAAGEAAASPLAVAAGTSAGLWTSGVTDSGLSTLEEADSEGLATCASANGFLGALSPVVASAGGLVGCWAAHRKLNVSGGGPTKLRQVVQLAGSDR